MAKELNLPLEDLIPKILTSEDKLLLERLRNHKEKYEEIKEETLNLSYNEVWFSFHVDKINMDYYFLSDEDMQRIMVGLIYKKGYVFNE
ncbi:MAG: hypothetical protein AABW56_04880 [Nanoarchaeota archaeon]